MAQLRSTDIFGDLNVYNNLNIKNSLNIDEQITQPLIIGNLEGNANTQTKLNSQKTISISGDGTGSQSFDGSQGIDISLQISNDSHSHSNSTITSVDWPKITNVPDPTITLSGDLSGSGTLTNLGSVTISQSVQDDSHNHVIGNIDGLQTQLNGKSDTGHTHSYLPLSGGTLTNKLIIESGGDSNWGINSSPSLELGKSGVNTRGYIKIWGNSGSDYSVVQTTTSNLHLDSSINGKTYINFYSETDTYINKNGGNVGIGTTSPSQKLDVSGNIKQSGTIYEGGTQLSSKYAQSSHTHQISNITNLQTTLDGKQQSSHTHSQYLTSVSWQDVLSKPTTFTPSNHSHSILHIEDIRNHEDGDSNFELTPDQMPSNSVSSYFGYVSNAGSSWRSILNLKGWGTGYANWQLIGPQTSSVDEDLYFRSGINQNWNTPKKIWHSGNFDPNSKSNTSHTHQISNITNLQTTLDGKQQSSHTHSYLPLSGGSLTGNLTFANDKLLNHNTTNSYDKIRVWSSGNYTIGMKSAQTYGYLNDYAMTFTMNQDADRGFLWRDVSDTQSDGQMSLTTDGRLYLKNIQNVGSLSSRGDITGSKVYGAVYNDYAEYRNSSKMIDYGYVQIEDEKGNVIKCNEDRSKKVQGISSDTLGFGIGKQKDSDTPIAVAGRVLVYQKNKDKLKVGDQVCSTKNGKVRKMKWWEKILFPEQVIGIISEFPNYKTWGTDNTKINGRIWIKI